jgi:steroid delta-isomerase-like uncharacterized protein
MTETMPADSKIDLAFAEEWGRRFAAAWNAHDPDEVAALCTDDVIWVDAALPEPAVGKQAVGDFVTATGSAFPDFKVEDMGELYVSPVEPLALCPYVMSGTMLGGWEHSGSEATERRFEVRGIDQWVFRGELMCRYVTYYDIAEMARQLGTESAA